jgi:hypothetical protein
MKNLDRRTSQFLQELLLVLADMTRISSFIKVPREILRRVFFSPSTLTFALIPLRVVTYSREPTYMSLPPLGSTNFKWHFSYSISVIYCMLRLILNSLYISHVMLTTHYMTKLKYKEVNLLRIIQLVSSQHSGSPRL